MTLAEQTPLSLFLRGHRPLRFLLAAISGVMLALAFPNAGISWLIFFFLAPLLASIATAASKREAFLQGWLFFTVQWLITVPWVIRVMSHYGGLPYLLGVGIFVLMSLYLGLFGGLFGWAAYVLMRGWKGCAQDSVLGWLAVPLAWAAVEFLRTHALTGFPWDLIATAIVDYTPLVQLDRELGPYALGALIAVPAVVLTWLGLTPASRGKRLLVAGATLSMLAVWWGAGRYRIWSADIHSMATSDRVYRAALLQPNISQEMRWSESSLIEIFNRMTAMTDEAMKHRPDVVIWPESTVPLTYATTTFYRQAIESRSVRTHTDVILGSVAQDEHNPDRLWNAAYLVSDGKTIGHYDKIRLVPFGEYVPLRKAFFFAGKLVHAVGTFEFGTRDTPLEGKLKYGLAICYEVVFPQVPSTQVRHGANVLVTITNDAWYDGTSAPRQHLDMARLRAVETDRYILRAGTTGISAFIDPNGRLLQSLAMGKQGILYVAFQPHEAITPYVRYGDVLAWVCCIIVVLVMGWRVVRRDDVDSRPVADVSS
jgi:apolipoprotein N-acyltransferase